ncbi:MAG: ArsA family ATPase [Actinomycetota bacterium]
MTEESLDRLVGSREIVVCCGSGGVGKTSVAAAIALGAAARLGGRVLVLTIDPARRLATALGLEGIGNEARRVPDAVVAAAVGAPPRGELWAAMLDMKQSWDDLVRTHAEDEATAERILENRLYRNLTSRFVQSHDYIAMERLFEIHSAGEYDLIVIDTPPTRNAIDFLEAPARMAEFFGGRFLRWLTLPYRVGGRRGSRVLELASRPFSQLADRILGGAFLEDIGEFFANFQSMYDGFVARAEAVERLLHDRRTTFAVVTTLEPAPLHEAERFCAALGERDLHLGALVCNRTLPDLLLDPEAAAAAATCRLEADVVAAELGSARVPGLEDPRRVARVLRIVGESFDRFAVVARREAELRRELAGGPEVVARVPALAGDVGDVDALAAIARHLFSERAPEGP